MLINFKRNIVLINNFEQKNIVLLSSRKTLCTSIIKMEKEILKIKIIFKLKIPRKKWK